MMKAQFREAGGELTLQVCGRLTDGWVQELEKGWREASAAHPGARLWVDLRGVTFIDEAGERLLRRMHGDGATFRAAGLLVQEVIQQITGGAR